MKHPAKIDIAVLILFFNRPDSLRKVFAEVRKARPSRLFLYQDGPRGERDMEGIMACREVVADIDWECDVRQMYQERNFGCDPSEYISQKWAFSLADKCIVLEDDDVPSQSFFPFCKEMLDRYEHDERIVMVSGFNSEERIDGCPYDYLFTSYMSIWGWASWRRVVDRWEGDYSFLDRDYDMGQLRALMRQRKMNFDTLRACQSHRDTGREYYETILWANAMLGSPAAPFRLTVDDGTGIGAAKAAGAYSIYPNPVRTTLFVSGDTDRLRMVTVLSANGSVVARTDSYTPEGIDVTALLAGTYIVVLDSDTGRTVKKMLKVD